MDRLSIIKSPITAELEEYKAMFDSALSSSNPLLNEVTTFIQQRNGKMMRPILVLLISKLCGETVPATLSAAVALELLHTASLVHDDVVDESDERRGQLSVNALFNNKVAVLSGDYLLGTCLVQAAKTQDIRIVNLISKLGQDLSEGELLQLSNTANLHFSEEIYYEVIRKKTAALFSACTRAAALSVKAPDMLCEKMHLLGEYIGICFQIRDDIFDYYEDARIGKPTGNDMVEGKLTLPVIYALNCSQSSWAKELAVKVKRGEASSDEIRKLIDFTKESGGIEYAQRAMYECREKAYRLLDEVEDSPIKTSLITYLDYVVDRNK